MYKSASPSPAVVVGVDGSRWSVDAALWAVDEAVSRDVPLRLLYVVEPRGHGAVDPQQEAQDLACADVSVRRALVAIESTEKPVKVEWEVLQGHPSRVLLDASRSADLLCLGSLGIAHATGYRLGSTSATLASSAPCPVAIVRSANHHGAMGPRHVVVEVDESPDSAVVLEAGISEARLRGAPLTVLATRPTTLSDGRDRVPDDGVRARLDKRLAQHRVANPDVEFNPVAIRGSTMNYLDRQADSIQLLVIGRHRRPGMGEIVGTARSASPQVNCTALICQNGQRL